MAADGVKHWLDVLVLVLINSSNCNCIEERGTYDADDAETSLLLTRGWQTVSRGLATGLEFSVCCDKCMYENCLLQNNAMIEKAHRRGNMNTSTITYNAYKHKYTCENVQVHIHIQKLVTAHAYSRM